MDTSIICSAITKLQEILDMQDGDEKKSDLIRLVAKSDEFSDLCRHTTNQVPNMSDEELCSVMQTVSSMRDLGLWPDSMVDALYVEGQRRVSTFGIQQLHKFANFYATFDLSYTGRFKGSAIVGRFSELLDQFSASCFHEMVTIMDSTLFLTTSHFKGLIAEKIRAILTDVIERGCTDEVTGGDIAKILRWAALDGKKLQGGILKNSDALLDVCCRLLNDRIQSTSSSGLCIALLNLRMAKHGDTNLQKAICDEAVGRLPKTTDVNDIGCILHIMCFFPECIDRAKSDMINLIEIKIKEVLQQPEQASLGYVCFAARLLQYEFSPELLDLLCTCINHISIQKEIHRNVTQTAKYLSQIVGLSRSSARAWDCLLLKFEEIQDKLYNPYVIVDFLICQLEFPKPILSEVNLDLSSYEELLGQLGLSQMGELARQLLSLRRRPCIPRNVKIWQIMRLLDQVNYKALENIQDIQSAFHLSSLFSFVLNEQDPFPDPILNQITEQTGQILCESKNFKHALMWARTLDKNKYLDETLLDTLASICAENIKNMDLEDIIVIVQAVCFLSAHLSPQITVFLQECADRICQDLLGDLEDISDVTLLVSIARNLSYVEVFPESLLRKIFSTEFLEKVGEAQADRDILAGNYCKK